MADSAQTTQNSDPIEGDPSKTESPDVQAGERDAGGGEPDYKRMYLESKSKVERVNTVEAQLAAREAELAVLRARPEPAPAAPGNGDDDSDDDDAVVNEWASKGDGVARKTKRLARELAETRKQLAEIVPNIAHANMIRDMPLERRQKVYEHFQANRHRFGDPKAAEADIIAQESTTEIQRLNNELKRLNSEKKIDPDVAKGIPTHQREISASEHKIRTMTAAEFDAEKERIKLERGPHSAMLFAQELLDDKIRLKD